MCTSGRVCALRSENEKWTLKSNSSCHIINWILASGACTTEIFFLLSHGAFSFPLPTNLAFIHIYIHVYMYIYFFRTSVAATSNIFDELIMNARGRNGFLESWHVTPLTGASLSVWRRRIYRSTLNEFITVELQCYQVCADDHYIYKHERSIVSNRMINVN